MMGISKSGRAFLACFWCFMFMGLHVHVSGAQTDESPNIIFILADDHSYHDVGAYGNEEVSTPNIDALAEDGITVERAYNMGSWTGAVCIPSRTMLQTGQSLWNAREVEKSRWRKRGNYWPQLLSEAGYRTYLTGKWHVPGISPDTLYDVVRHERPGMPGDTEEMYQRPSLPSQEDPWSPTDPAFGGHWEGGKHWSEVLVEDFEIMLEDARKHDDPFFMYLAFNAPHDPRQSPHEFVGRYPQEELQLPDNWLPEYPYNEEIGSGRTLRDERLAPFPRTPYATRVQRREYYGIITHLDHQVGRIRRALEASGEADNTWIVYTADHGLAAGQHGLMGKQNVYEHSLRAPFIIVGPGIEGGRRVEGPIYIQDVVPTTLELAGLDVPDTVQFNSFMPMIEGESDESGRDAIYAAYRSHQRAVIKDDYKLIAYPKAERVRLFDLEDDPYEVYDLVEQEQEQYESKIRELFGTLDELQEKRNDDLDLEASFSEWY